MHTSTHVSTVVNACPNARTAAVWVREEADHLIEQLSRRARGFDKGPWRDDIRQADRTPYNRTATRIHESVSLSFALARRFA